MIESPLGRRWSLASSTFVTAFFCVIFVGVESPWAVRASTVGISLSATVRVDIMTVLLLIDLCTVGHVGCAVWVCHVSQ